MSSCLLTSKASISFCFVPTTLSYPYLPVSHRKGTSASIEANGEY